jgi:eukaryotic-like serine/threonine-protein kinase
MGRVYEARHTRLPNKRFAIKVLHADLAMNSDLQVRFQREAETAASVEHPSVVGTYDIGRTPQGWQYMVCEHLTGLDLHTHIDRSGPLRDVTVIHIGKKLCEAVEAAHAKGVIHRDLKPHNVFLVGDFAVGVPERPNLKVLDFGLSRFVDRDSQLTKTGVIMGTPGYMSPEQAVGDRVDHRTDLYALGVVLWECLTGKALWEGADVMSIITRQMRDVVPPPRELLGDPLFPRTLDQLVVRLCARLPDERPEHAGLVRDELRALARRRLTPMGALAEQASLAITAARTQLRALPMGSRAVILAACVGLTLVVASALLRRSPSAPASPSAQGAATSESSAASPNEPASGSQRSGTEHAERTERTERAESAKPAKATTSEPSLASRALQLAKSVVRDQRPAEPKTTVPKELEADAQQVLEGKRSVDRRRSATKLLRYAGPAHLPPHVLSVARLERARTCREREDAIGELDELHDQRTLPAVKRIVDAPRTGCGFLSLSDCYACVRSPARKTAAKLAGTADDDD